MCREWTLDCWGPRPVVVSAEATLMGDDRDRGVMEDG